MRLRRLSLLCGVVALCCALGACDTAVVSIAQTPAVDAQAVIPVTYFTSKDSGIKGLAVTDGHELWRAKVGHANWAPLIVGNTIFAITIQSPEQGPAAVAVRLNDGHILWQTSLPSSYVNYKLDSDGATVVINAAEDGYYALNAADGTQRWHIVQSATEHTSDSFVPFIHGNRVYLVTDHLIAVDTQTGKDVWAADPPNPAASAIADDTAVYREIATRISALDFTTGKFLWESASTGSLLAARGGMVFLSGADTINNQTIQEVVALDATSGQVKWRFPLKYFGAILSHPPFALTRDTVYTYDTDHAYAVRLADGQAAWSANLHQNNLSVSAITLHAGVLFAYQEAYHPEFGGCAQNCQDRVTTIDPTTGRVYWQRTQPDTQLLAIDRQP